MVDVGPSIIFNLGRLQHAGHKEADRDQAAGEHEQDGCTDDVQHRGAMMEIHSASVRHELVTCCI